MVVTNGHNGLVCTHPNDYCQQLNKTERIEREKSLLAVALDCYAANRWESVTIASIAKRAGVAKGTVYLHFSGKDEIFALLALQFFEGLLKQSEKITANTGRKQLKELIKTIFQYHHNEQKYRHVVQYCQRGYFKQNINSELRTSLDQTEAQLRELISACLKKGNADGSLQISTQDTDAAIYYTLKGALHQLWCETPQKHEIPMEFIRTTTDYILSGVGEGGSKATATTAATQSPFELILES